jgi:hypothetical protein
VTSTVQGTQTVSSNPSKYTGYLYSTEKFCIELQFQEINSVLVLVQVPLQVQVQVHQILVANTQWT